MYAINNNYFYMHMYMYLMAAMWEVHSSHAEAIVDQLGKHLDGVGGWTCSDGEPARGEKGEREGGREGWTNDKDAMYLIIMMYLIHDSMDIIPK